MNFSQFLARMGVSARSEPGRAGVDDLGTHPGERREIASPPLIGIAILLFVAVLGGGTSGDFPARAMAIEFTAVILIAVVLMGWKGRPPSWPQIVGVGLILLLPVVQMIPLPAAVWTALPGRAVARDIAAFIDSGMVRPITLDSNATLKSWMALCIPVAAFLATLQLDARARMLTVKVVIGLAVLSVLLGAIQMISGMFYPFASEHEGLPIGLFANRNHQAALMYIAAIFCVGLMLQRNAAGVPRYLLISITCLFVATILATQSRAGLALAVLGLLLCAGVAWTRINAKIAMLALVVLGGALVLLSHNSVVASALARFAGDSSEGRYELWPEVLHAALVYFPTGSGMGTFVRSYQANEQLASLTPYYVNHAHNEYLEILLESGVAGLMLVVIFLVWLTFRAWKIFAREPKDGAGLLARIALIGLVLYLLHSGVDYPVRTYAHIAIFGMLCGLIVRPSTEAIWDKARHRKIATRPFAGHGIAGGPTAVVPEQSIRTRRRGARRDPRNEP